jgi:hypothetical protein
MRSAEIALHLEPHAPRNHPASGKRVADAEGMAFRSGEWPDWLSKRYVM